MTEIGRILAIDYGMRRVGLAISDPTRSIASPLKTIDVKKSAVPLMDQLVSIVDEYEVSELVVGLPLTESGHKGEMALRVEDFVSGLKERLDCGIKMLDERFSSARAIRAIHEMGEKTGKDKGKVDRISAVFILQNYLESIAANRTGLRENQE